LSSVQATKSAARDVEDVDGVEVKVKAGTPSLLGA
jgi:hypothetical protein